MVVPFSCHPVTEHSREQLASQMRACFFFEMGSEIFFSDTDFKKLFKSPLDFVNCCYLWNFFNFSIKI